jgi:hypothetical protein
MNIDFVLPVHKLKVFVHSLVLNAPDWLGRRLAVARAGD